MAHAVCLVPREDEYYEHGEEERERGLPRPPPPPDRHPTDPRYGERKKRPSPIIRYTVNGLCAPEGACHSPATCQSEMLCVPHGSRAAPLLDRKDRWRPALSARQTETPFTESAPGMPAPLPPLHRPGCAGCATNPPEGASALGLGAAALLALARRRKRRR